MQMFHFKKSFNSFFFFFKVLSLNSPYLSFLVSYLSLYFLISGCEPTFKYWACTETSAAFVRSATVIVNLFFFFFFKLFPDDPKWQKVQFKNHYVKYASIQVFSDPYFLQKDWIKDTVDIRENTGQRKPAFCLVYFPQWAY